MSSPDQSELKTILSEYERQEGFPVHFVGSSINTVVIAEEHGSFTNVQPDLIAKLAPGKLLHEGLRGYTYNPNNRKFSPQPNRMATPVELNIIMPKLQGNPEEVNDGIKPIVDLSTKLKIPLIGCDLTYVEIIRYIEDTDPAMWAVMSNLPSGDPRFMKGLTHFTQDRRDAFIAKFIAKNQGSTARITVAIVGWLHAKYMYEHKVLNNCAYTEQLSEGMKRVNVWPS